MNRFLSTVVSWLRAGYPTGVPETDYLPILALLSRRLTKDEVILIARELMHLPDPDFADIGAKIMRITDELPAPTDVERVREKLLAHGWPLDDPRDSEDVGSPRCVHSPSRPGPRRCHCWLPWRACWTVKTVRWSPCPPAICAKVSC